MKVIANRVALPTLLLACTMAAGAAAQQPRPAFEVASVRPQTKPATFAEIAGWPRVRPGGRLVGSHATVIEAIPPNDVGMVRVGAEEWRAEGVDGVAVALGAQVEVDSVRGTRAIVRPIDLTD